MKKVDMVVSPQTDCAGGGVVCEVTPTGLLMIGDKLLDIRRTSGGDASAGCNAL